MTPFEDGSTSPTLLVEVADWGNHPAWIAFRNRYDPLLRRWCRSYGLDADSSDEVCQRIWTELAARLKSFRYDPSQSFRAWLKCICRCRVVDLLRERRADSFLSLDDRDLEPAVCGHRAVADVKESAEDGEAADAEQRFLRSEAEQVQAAVRGRIQPRTWDAFWLVAVCDWTVERTAETLGMTHIAVYAATQRVSGMLRDEGARRSKVRPAAG